MRGRPTISDLAEVRRFQEFLRDYKKIREARRQGNPVPLSPERLREVEDYIRGEGPREDGGEG